MQNKLFNNIMLTLIGKGLELTIFYIIQILLTKFLPTSEFGIYSKWLIAVNYATVILTFGLNYSILFFTTSKKITIWSALLINIIMYCILRLSLMGLLYFYDFDLFEKKYFILYTFLSLLITTYITVPMIYEDFLLYNILNLLKRIFSLVFLSLIFFSVFIPSAINVIKLDSYSLMLLMIICIILIFFYLIRKEKLIILFNLSILKNYIKYGFKNISFNILGISMYSLDVFIVSYFLDSISIAYYVIAGSLVKISWFIVDNAGTVVFPKFIKNIHNNNDTFKIINAINQFSLLITVFLIVLFIFFGKDFLTVIYKPDYQKAYLATIILLLGSPGMVIYKLYSRYFASKNSFRMLYYSLIISIILNVILNFVLIPRWGIEGAAFSSFVSYWFCGLFIAANSNNNIFNLFNFNELKKLILKNILLK